MIDLAVRMRAHVVNRGGLSKDADGNPVIPNGAWVMMLEAADELDRLERRFDLELDSYAKDHDLAAARAERDALALQVLTLTNERDNAQARSNSGA